MDLQVCDRMMRYQAYSIILEEDLPLFLETCSKKIEFQRNEIQFNLLILFFFLLAFVFVLQDI